MKRLIIFLCALSTNIHASNPTAYQNGDQVTPTRERSYTDLTKSKLNSWASFGEETDSTLDDSDWTILGEETDSKLEGAEKDKNPSNFTDHTKKNTGLLSGMREYVEKFFTRNKDDNNQLMRNQIESLRKDSDSNTQITEKLTKRLESLQSEMEKAKQNKIYSSENDENKKDSDNKSMQNEIESLKELIKSLESRVGKDKQDQNFDFDFAGNVANNDTQEQDYVEKKDHESLKRSLEASQTELVQHLQENINSQEEKMKKFMEYIDKKTNNIIELKKDKENNINNFSEVQKNIEDLLDQTRTGMYQDYKNMLNNAIKQKDDIKVDTVKYLFKYVNDNPQEFTPTQYINENVKNKVEAELEYKLQAIKKEIDRIKDNIISDLMNRMLDAGNVKVLVQEHIKEQFDPILKDIIYYLEDLTKETIESQLKELRNSILADVTTIVESKENSEKEKL